MALLQPWGITAAPLFSVSQQGVSAGCVLMCLCPGEQRLKWARCGWGEMPQSGSRCLFSERVWLGRTCSKWPSVLDLLLKQFLGCFFFFFMLKLTTWRPLTWPQCFWLYGLICLKEVCVSVTIASHRSQAGTVLGTVCAPRPCRVGAQLQL